MLWLAGRVSGLRLVYNASDSELRGWYLTRPVAGPLARGQLVVFPVPEHVADLVAERGWLPRSVPLLKEVGAVAGDMVCVGADLRIRGRRIGPVHSEDSAGRPLPVRRRGCFTVEPGHIFPVGLSLARSFDGRYFGEIPVRAVEALAVPLWTSPPPKATSCRGCDAATPGSLTSAVRRAAPDGERATSQASIVGVVLAGYVTVSLLFTVAWGLACAARDGDFPGLVPAIRSWWRRGWDVRAGDRSSSAHAGPRRTSDPCPGLRPFRRDRRTGRPESPASSSANGIRLAGADGGRP